VVQPQPQVRSSIQEAPSSPHSTVPPQPAAPASQSPVMPQSSVTNLPAESHVVQTLPVEEVAEDVATAYDAAEDTGYSAIALYDYQAGWISPDFLNMGTLCHWVSRTQTHNLMRKHHIAGDLNTQKSSCESVKSHTFHSGSCWM
jgi:hypothetical protein